MAELVVTERALADITAVVTGLADIAGKRVSGRYARDFEALFDRLVEFPSSGAPRPRLGRDIRLGIVTPYLVFYQDDRSADIVRIVRVLHEKRHITRRLMRE